MLQERTGDAGYDGSPEMRREMEDQRGGRARACVPACEQREVAFRTESNP